MSTRVKVITGLIIIFVITAAIGAISIYSFSSLINSSSKVQKELRHETFYLSKTVDHLKWDKKLMEILYTGKNVEIQVDPAKCALGKWYYPYIESDEYKELPVIIKNELSRLGNPHSELHKSAISILEMVNSGDKAGAFDQYKNITQKHLHDTQQVIYSLNKLVNKEAGLKNQDMQRQVDSSNLMIIVSFVIGAIIFAIVFFISFRALGVLEKLKPFNKQFARAALGDLTVRADMKRVNCSQVMECGKTSCPDYGKDGVLCWFDVGSYAPEFGREVHCPKILNKVYKDCTECRVYKTVNTDEVAELGAWYNKFLENLDNMMAVINSTTENLNDAVQEIAGGNENLSQRTSEQASALEEVASTIEEATAAINQNAENSERARELTDNGAKKSESGTRIALEAIDAIGKMNESSKQIAEIISMINDIAFQTNLLALNAAVEAARAGEQGRGFAVVAGEVRNLAQKSGNAAKEIEDLIKDAVNRVEIGSELVNKTGDALTEISDAATQTSMIIAEIAAAGKEQKQGIEQIHTAITEMDTMTQQNASLVEETASASEEMANQSQELNEMVDKFKVTGRERGGSGNAIEKSRAVNAAIGHKDTSPVKDKTAPVRSQPEDIQKIMHEDGFEEF